MILLRHLPVFWRIFLRNWRIIGINTVGLSLGLVTSIILGSYCISEYSFDAFHENAHRIYQLWATVEMGPNSVEINRFSTGTGFAIERTYSGVTAFCRINKKGSASIGTKNFKSEEHAIVFSDKSLFEMFSFRLVEGVNSLDEPRTILVSEDMRKKFFGNKEAVGETMTYNDSITLRVVGVFKNIPELSTLRFEFAISHGTLKILPGFREESDEQKIGLGSTQTYLLLEESKSANDLEQQLPKMKDPFKIKAYHLESMDGARVRGYGDLMQSKVPLFTAIAITLFTVAILNSILITATLTIARTKEIAIRKINGAAECSIFSIFIIEATILALTAVLVATGLSILVVDVFKEILEISFNWTLLLDAHFAPWLAIVLVILIIAGCVYPVILSRITTPVNILKNLGNSSGIGGFIHRFSVFLQLVVSSTLILISFLISDGLSYFGGKNIGLDLENVAVVRLQPEEARYYPLLHHQINQLNGVDAVGASNVSFFEEEPTTVMVSRVDSSNAISLSLIIADSDFVKLMGIANTESVNAKGILLNQTAVRSFSYSYPENLIGYQIQMGGQLMSVSSVIQDFNFRSPRTKIGNLGIMLADDSSRVFGFTGCSVYIKISPKLEFQSIMTQIEPIFRRTIPAKPFTYSILKDNYLRDFKTELNLSNSISLFATVAILTSIFGLIGLLSYQIALKMKNVSVRRILGADFFDIAWLFSKELLLFIIVSLAVSVPMAIYSVSYFFQTFSDKPEIRLGPIVSGLAIVVLVIVSLYGFFVREAVMNNPVKYLRKE